MTIPLPQDWSVTEADSNDIFSYFIIINSWHVDRYHVCETEWDASQYISSFDITGEDNSIFAGAVVMVMILNKSRLSLNEIWKAVPLSQGRYTWK